MTLEQVKSLDAPVTVLYVCGAGAEVICPWEAFGDMELSDLAQFGIV